MANEKKMTMGVIVGNRGFFPDHLAKSGREEILAVLAKYGINAIALGIDDSKYGAVETHEEAKRCAELFRKHEKEIDGVIVTLPNFGDERAIADTLRLARLGVPVLVQATPDAPSKMTISHRRDSFCGKMSACNNLKQYGIPYSLTKLHTVALDSPEFAKDLENFAAGLPRRSRSEKFAHWRHRCPPRGVQHRPLQRKIAGSQRHLHRNTRPQRSSWPHWSPQRQRRRRRGKARCDQKIHAHRRRARSGADKNGQARRRYRTVDETGRRSASARFSAGPRSKKISASSPAPS